MSVIQNKNLKSGGHFYEMIRLEDLLKYVLNEKVEVISHGFFNRTDVLLKVRLWVYSLSFLHLVIIATKLLTIDFTQSDDPQVWVYANFRWKLITCWFNLISLIYLPTCIYCDWRELRGEADWKHVKSLNQIRFTIFTSILFPTTTFADILFWRLWNKDRELLAPVAVDTVVPFWTQHCMHTVSLVVILLDLVLVPRKRPKSFVPGLSLMMLFISSYIYVCADSYRNGEYLYPVLKLFSGFKLIVLYFYVIVEHLFYFVGQFFVNDFIWERRRIYAKRINAQTT